MEDYERYLLKKNPFPPTAIINPWSPDDRINGTIFKEEVLRDEIRSLRDKIDARTNMIYIAGIKFNRGVGKSALMIHEWRRLEGEPNTTSTYIRCKEKDKPADFCRAIVAEWHQQHYLWRAFKNLLLKYSEDRKSLRLTKEAIETLFNVYRTPPDSLPLTLYTHIINPVSLAKDLDTWVSEKTGVAREIIPLLTVTYLTNPSHLVQLVSSTRMDKIEIFKGFLEILTSFGFKRHYLFLDQFEDTIMTTPVSRIGEFCLGIRRMLEATTDKASIIVTLHPDSEMKLDTQSARNLLDTLAPLDLGHRIDVMYLEAGSEVAVDLAEEYLHHFRTEDSPYPTYPLDPEVIRFICFLKEGVIRGILQQLHVCLKFGASIGNPPIDMDLILSHSRETLGIQIGKDHVDRFRSEVKKNA